MSVRIRIFPVVMLGSSANPPPPPPPPNPPPPPPPGGVCCLAAGSKVLMADGSHKSIEDIEPGDQVIGLRGRAVVKAVHHTALGPDRTMMTLANLCGQQLRISDDHDLWCRGAAGEGWGTFNPQWWAWEADVEGTHDVPAFDLRDKPDMLLATASGFMRVAPDFEECPDVHEIIWSLELESGGSFIADGYVVIGSNCSKADIEGVTWKGLQFWQADFSGPAPTTCND